MLKETECIVEFAVSEQSKTNAWKTLVNITKDIPIGTTSKQYLQQFEVDYMEQYHSSNPLAKKANGKWKFSMYLPKPYLSAKSVINSAEKLEVSLTDSNGVPLGKTEVQREIALRKPIRSIHSDVDKHIKYLKLYAGVSPQMLEEVLVKTNQLLTELHDE